MATYQNANQAYQTLIPGQLGASPNQNIKTVRINPSSQATVIQAMSPVKLLAGVGAEILVDVTSGVTDGPVYGVIIGSTKKNTYAAGDICQIACRGSVIAIESSAAVNRATKVSIDPAGPTCATDTTATHWQVGTAIGQVAGANALVWIELDPADSAIPATP